MTEEFIIRYSRWKAILPAIVGLVICTIGYGLCFERIFGPGIMALLLGIIFGLFLMLAGTLLSLISLIRIIRKPKVLVVTNVGIVYFYSTFGSQKKKIKLA